MRPRELLLNDGDKRTVLSGYVKLDDNSRLFVGAWPNDDEDGLIEAMQDHWMVLGKRSREDLVIVDHSATNEAKLAEIAREVYSLQKRVEKLERMIENANR